MWVDYETWISRSNEAISKFHQRETKGIEEVAAAQPYNDDELTLAVNIYIERLEDFKVLIGKCLNAPHFLSHAGTFLKEVDLHPFSYKKVC